MFKRITYLMVLMLFGVLFGGQSYAQPTCQTFKETGKTVCGDYLEYWLKNGGLAQQGYPISEPMTEVSETNGKSYAVQYFERAVFELHPENAPPYDVLLTLLGSLYFKQKYPDNRTLPAQIPNTEAGSRLFPETGKRLGGIFLTYWNSHGALAQQGYPISEEFIEVSDLNGKPYKVQYFERAVFEYHPENAGTLYEILLSQLGRARYDARTAVKPSPTAVAPPTTIPGATPSPTKANEADCSGIPDDAGVTATPRCGPLGMEVDFLARGFTPGESVQVHNTRPDGTTTNPSTFSADSNGDLTEIYTNPVSRFGVWAVTMTGLQSGKRATGYYKVTGPDISGCIDGPPPPSINGNVVPSCGMMGETFMFSGWGFKPGEEVGYYWTQPNSVVYGTTGHAVADKDGDVVGATLTHSPGVLPGVWAITLEGVDSHNRAIGYIKVYRP